MVQRDKSGIQGRSSTLFPDNTTREISPADLRDFITDLLDSYPNINGLSTGQIPVATAVEGVYQDSGITDTGSGAIITSNERTIVGRADISGLATDQILYNNNGTFAASSARQMPNNVIAVTPNGLMMGDGQIISAGVRGVNFSDALNRRALAIGSEYDDTGTLNTFLYILAARTLTAIANGNTQDLSDPQTYLFTATADSLTRSFTVIPATTGTLRVEAFAGTDATAPRVVDNSFAVMAGQPLSEMELEIRNPSLINSGDQLFIRFSGVQLRGGVSTVPLTDGQTLPFLSSDIQAVTRANILSEQSLEFLQDTVAAMFTGGTHVGISFAYDDTDGFIDATVGVTSPVPSLHNFSIDVPSQVTQNTDINGAHVATFDLSNHTQLTALEMIVTVGDNVTMTVPMTDGVQTQNVTISGTSTASLGTITFQLSGTYAGGTVTSNVYTTTIVAPAGTHEQGYYGVRATNDFATTDLGNLTAVDVTQSGTVFNITFALTSPGVAGILLPEDREIVTITNPNAPDPSRNILNDFDIQTEARVENSVNFTLYTEVNVSGFPGTLSVIVTTE